MCRSSLSTVSEAQNAREIFSGVNSDITRNIDLETSETDILGDSAVQTHSDTGVCNAFSSENFSRQEFVQNDQFQTLSSKNDDVFMNKTGARQRTDNSESKT